MPALLLSSSATAVLPYATLSTISMVSPIVKYPSFASMPPRLHPLMAQGPLVQSSDAHPQEFCVSRSKYASDTIAELRTLRPARTSSLQMLAAGLGPSLTNAFGAQAPHAVVRLQARSARTLAPRMVLSEDEIPSERLIRAVERLGGGRVSAADVAAQGGMDLLETRRQLLLLARLVGADMQVSSEGELVFVFSRGIRNQLRAASWKAKARDTWTQVKPGVYWLLRASFGVALVSSVAIATVGIAALSASGNRDDDRQSSSSPMVRLGPNPLDFLYYSTRPYGYARYNNGPDEEMGFLQSCFSLLFGDGDPNRELESRQARAVAALVRAQGGAVTAEQLAPLLLPPFTPKEAEQMSMGEGWVTDALVRFGGEPVVTNDGDIVYVFPELMITAGKDPPRRLLAPSSRAGSLAVSSDARQAVSSALLHDSPPDGWRPSIGESVVVVDILEKAYTSAGWGRVRAVDRSELAPFVGREGVVVRDDRDSLPFQVDFGGNRRASFSRRELRPAVSADLALKELPYRFSIAPPGQLVAAAALGVLNIGAVSYLGNLLRAARLGYIGASASTVAGLSAIYPALLLYAVGFVAVPVIRSAALGKRNREIERRNQVREAWGAALAATPWPALRRKLDRAKAMRPTRKELRESDAVFRSSSDGMQDSPPSLDDFDRRLAKRDRSQ
uniref:Uncharacterized protein n=1 Tax=Chrysotila carterae TaxID=13221 RepID=A0A7S4BCP5_CHRCT